MPDTIRVQCYDCKATYNQGYQEGALWPPDVCGACGSERIVVACCADPKPYGGKCDNCGQWISDVLGVEDDRPEGW